MYRPVELNLAYDLMTLLTASKKSFSVATFRRDRIANIPASVQTDRISAPVEFGHRRASNSHRISRYKWVKIYHYFVKSLVKFGQQIDTLRRNVGKNLVALFI